MSVDEFLGMSIVRRLRLRTVALLARGVNVKPIGGGALRRRVEAIQGAGNWSGSAPSADG